MGKPYSADFKAKALNKYYGHPDAGNPEGHALTQTAKEMGCTKRMLKKWLDEERQKDFIAVCKENERKAYKLEAKNRELERTIYELREINRVLRTVAVHYFGKLDFGDLGED
jgi:hypothetical protein